jgi:hypothetical protein
MAILSGATRRDTGCLGATDHEYGLYRPCCGKHTAFMDDYAMGWGSFCKVLPDYEGEESVPEVPMKVSAINEALGIELRVPEM